MVTSLVTLHATDGYRNLFKDLKLYEMMLDSRTNSLLKTFSAGIKPRQAEFHLHTALFVFKTFCRIGSDCT
jgi:hypothetical protein